jgi:small subunit ribosomal protein S10|tara:strand:+ start:61 stop:375 length:315 start_codon:yes stop_codon:yes gene_type:complete
MSNNQKERVRIQLKSFDHKLLDISFQKIQKIAEETDCKLVGPIPLPTKRRRYCVLTSPHVYKDAREHFEIRVHKRVVDVYINSLNESNSFLKIDLPAGVSISLI